MYINTHIERETATERQRDRERKSTMSIHLALFSCFIALISSSVGLRLESLSHATHIYASPIVSIFVKCLPVT